MKNGKMKLNRTKIVARVMLVILLFSSTLNLAGCGEPHVKKGQYYDETWHGLGRNNLDAGFKIVSDTQEFLIDDVTLSMYIGIKNSSKDFAPQLFGSSDDVYYIIYVTNSINEPNGADYYINLLNHAYVIKEIPYDDAFENKEYNYYRVSWSRRIYNHCEKITIPKECLIEGNACENPYVILGICLVQKHPSNSNQYLHAYNITFLSLWYQILNDNTVVVGIPHIDM